jgi:hypothetical protein
MDQRPAMGAQARFAMPDPVARPRSEDDTLDPVQVAYLATNGIPSSEAAALLELNQPWVAELVRRGQLHPLETPLGRLYDPDEVRQLAHARRIAQAGRPRRGRPRKQRPEQSREVVATPTPLPA